MVFSSYVGMGQYIQLSTLSSMSGKNTFNHVLGQSSVVSGVSYSSGLLLRAGFKQPGFMQKQNQEVNKINKENTFDFTTFPNPFHEKLSIMFSEKTQLPLQILVFDLLGNERWSGICPMGVSELLLENVQVLHAGKYFIHINQQGLPRTHVIIKEVN